MVTTGGPASDGVGVDMPTVICWHGRSCRYLHTGWCRFFHSNEHCDAARSAIRSYSMNLPAATSFDATCNEPNGTPPAQSYHDHTNSHATDLLGKAELEQRVDTLEQRLAQLGSGGDAYHDCREEEQLNTKCKHGPADLEEQVAAMSTRLETSIETVLEHGTKLDQVSTMAKQASCELVALAEKVSAIGCDTTMLKASQQHKVTDKTLSQLAKSQKLQNDHLRDYEHWKLEADKRFKTLETIPHEVGLLQQKLEATAKHDSARDTKPDARDQTIASNMDASLLAQRMDHLESEFQASHDCILQLTKTMADENQAALGKFDASQGHLIQIAVGIFQKKLADLGLLPEKGPDGEAAVVAKVRAAQVGLKQHAKELKQALACKVDLEITSRLSKLEAQCQDLLNIPSSQHGSPQEGGMELVARIKQLENNLATDIQDLRTRHQETRHILDHCTEQSQALERQSTETHSSLQALRKDLVDKCSQARLTESLSAQAQTCQDLDKQLKQILSKQAAEIESMQHYKCENHHDFTKVTEHEKQIQSLRSALDSQREQCQADLTELRRALDGQAGKVRDMNTQIDALQQGHNTLTKARDLSNEMQHLQKEFHDMALSQKEALAAALLITKYKEEQEAAQSRLRQTVDKQTKKIDDSMAKFTTAISTGEAKMDRQQKKHVEYMNAELTQFRKASEEKLALCSVHGENLKRLQESHVGLRDQLNDLNDQYKCDIAALRCSVEQTRQSHKHQKQRMDDIEGMQRSHLYGQAASRTPGHKGKGKK